MKRLIATLLFLVLAYGTVASARQDETQLPAGAKVYVHPMDGFETYIASAFQKKKVPVVLVADREHADFEMKGNSERDKAGWSKRIFGSGRDAVRASIQISNVKTGVIVCAIASDKSDAWSGMKSAAEHIAKNVAKKIKEDAEKAK
jgi:hypothetical protein